MSPRSIEVERERVPAATDGAPVTAGLEALQSPPAGCLCRFFEMSRPASRRCGCVATRSVAIPACGRHFGGASAASVKRFFSETEALVRHVPDRDGSPKSDWQLTAPQLSTSKRCCESGRRGIRSRPAWPASGRASREGASSATRVITPVGKADRAAASSPGGRCRAADRELGKYPPFRSAAEEPSSEGSWQQRGDPLGLLL
jgi:hypothetical protein